MRSEAVARGEIIQTPSSAFWVSLLSPSLRTSRIMLCSPVEFAGPIKVTWILSPLSLARTLIRSAKLLSGRGLKLVAGNQRTITLAVPGGNTRVGLSIASHSSHGSKSELFSTDSATLTTFFVGHGVVTYPMCSPSIGTNPLSLNPSSTACRARRRCSPCSL